MSSVVRRVERGKAEKPRKDWRKTPKRSQRHGAAAPLVRLWARIPRRR